MKPRNIKTKELEIGDIVFRKSIDVYVYYIVDVKSLPNNKIEITYNLYNLSNKRLWPNNKIRDTPELFFEVKSILYKVKK